MISVALWTSSERIAVQAEGHALFAPKGADIVCASVSVLLQGWVLGEKEICQSPIEIRRDGDFFFAEIMGFKDKDFLLFKSLSLSLIMLSRQYPENLKVSVEE